MIRFGLPTMVERLAESIFLAVKSVFIRVPLENLKS
jgi:hypothetical protein